MLIPRISLLRIIRRRRRVEEEDEMASVSLPLFVWGRGTSDAAGSWLVGWVSASIIQAPNLSAARIIRRIIIVIINITSRAEYHHRECHYARVQRVSAATSTLAMNLLASSYTAGIRNLSSQQWNSFDPPFSYRRTHTTSNKEAEQR